MKIISAQIYAYCLPLKHPLAVAGSPALKRSGYLVCLTSDCGNRGWGETAPLPGYSIETAAESLNQLKQFCQNIHSLEAGTISLSDRKELLAPSVRFGLESALLSLGWPVDKRLSSELSTSDLHDPIRVNALLQSSDINIEQEIKKLLGRGYTTLKIKLGRRKLDEEIELVNKALSTLPDTVHLRLDCNRSWTVGELAHFVESVAIGRIEYIEEPLPSLNDYQALPSGILFPLALDESLRGTEPKNLIENDRLTSIVLKPTMLGLVGSIEFVRIARKRNIGVTFSSAFESSVGIANIARLAAAYSSPETAVGLDTVTWFAEDILRKPLEVVNGRMELIDCSSIDDLVRLDLLKEVSIG